MSQNGKGSRNRVKDTKKYRENYDDIFRKPKSYSDWRKQNSEYMLYLEDFYSKNAPNSSEIPMTEYEFNNPKDFQ